MDAQETLRNLFDGLAVDPEARALYERDPEGFLSDHGFGDLPAGLLPQAVVQYADTAPLEIAEQLSPFVMAHSPVEPDATFEDPGDPLGALAGVGVALAEDHGHDVGDLDGHDEPDPLRTLDGGDPDDLEDVDPGFGSGDQGGSPSEPHVDLDDLDDLAPVGHPAIEYADVADAVGVDPGELDDLDDAGFTFDADDVDVPEAGEDGWDDVV